MGMKARVRDVPQTVDFINNATQQPGYPAEVMRTYEAQIIYSEGHAFQNVGKTKGDIGGAFQSQKIEITPFGGSSAGWIRRPSTTFGIPYAQEYFTIPLPSSNITTLMQTVRQKAAGDRNLFITYMNQVNPLGFSSSEMNALGAKAVDQMAPNSPVADTMTTLAEFLSERKFFQVPGNAGSYPGEYLNYQFGVAPTIGFAQDLRTAIRDQEKIIEQLARNSGRSIRRRGDVYVSESPIATSNTSGVYPGFLGVSPTTNVMQTGVYSVQTQTIKKAWFSGSFTYYLPEDGWMRKMAELDAVYGVKPGVDTAWELLPFSWLADYKVSMGSAISNMSKFSADGLVMPYGYLMGEKVLRELHTWEGQLRNGGGGFQRTTLSCEVVKTTKQRVRANPFGFGVLPGDLSTRQLSILAALGLSYL